MISKIHRADFTSTWDGSRSIALARLYRDKARHTDNSQVKQIYLGYMRAFSITAVCIAGRVSRDNFLRSIPAMDTSPDFFRICVYAGGRGPWIEAMGEKYSHALGEGFKNIAFTMVEGEARIYPTVTARQICAVLTRLYPEIELHPATFAEWIENEKDLSPV